MTLKKTGGIDWNKPLKELKYLNSHVVAVGFFANDNNARIITIVRANEYGAHIVPKNGEWLWIPSRQAIKEKGHSVKPNDIDHLFIPKGKHVACTADKNGKLTVYFYLMKKVSIPARPFIRKAEIENQRKYQRYIKVGLDEIFYHNGTGKALLNKLGKLAVEDIRESARRWTKPGDAPVTIETKKNTNNPLVDTGQMIRSVTYKILEV